MTALQTFLFEGLFEWQKKQPALFILKEIII